ncbi:MAG: peptidylprolyl isomerase [Desulfobacterales bacterium]
MAQDAPRVKLSTSEGDIVLALYPDRAPLTVDNFLRYVETGFYGGTVFHRVIRDFMIQGGGLTADLQRKATQEPVRNEADNGLKNLRGTVAMARTQEPHSATSQFFINTKDNGFLDYRESSPSGWGYCVFGKVVEGMDVVDRIEGAKTTTKGGFRDVPTQPVVIEGGEILR